MSLCERGYVMCTRWQRDGGEATKGQALAEYALILSLLVVSLVAVLAAVGPTISNIFTATVYELLGQVTPRPTLSNTEFVDTLTAVATHTPPSPPPPTTPAGGATPSPTPSITLTPSDTPTPTLTFTPSDTPTPSPIPPVVVRLEVESGLIQSPLTTVNDSGASACYYAICPNSSCGNDWDPTDGLSQGYVILNFSVPAEDDYVIWGGVYGPSNEDDSFWVQVDGGSWALWDIAHSPTWDRVSNRGGDDPVVYHLSTGSHTLVIGVREDGSMIDVVDITNDLSAGYSPASVHCP